MRILLIAQHFAPDEGALATRWGWLADALVARGHTLDVVVPSWRETGDEEQRPGVTVHRVKPMVHGLGLASRVANEGVTSVQAFARALPLRPDVVVATVPALAALPVGWAIARIRRVPLLLDLRDAWPELFENWREWGDYGSGTVRARARRPWRGPVFGAMAKVIGALRRRADAVVVTTENFATTLRGQGLANVHVVRNTAGTLAPATSVIAHDGLHVLYLGNIGRSQYLATAVRAVALCHERGVPVVLRIVGQGAHELSVKSLAKRLGAPVEFFPRVPRSETGPHLEWADTMLVSLRDWPEFDRTVPSKLYDALWSGRHISGSVSGEAASIIVETGAGDVVAPQDPEALAGLWADLAEHPEKLVVGSGGATWVASHADRVALGNKFVDVVEDLVR